MSRGELQGGSGASVYTFNKPRAVSDNHRKSLAAKVAPRPHGDRLPCDTGLSIKGSRWDMGFLSRTLKTDRFSLGLPLVPLLETPHLRSPLGRDCPSSLAPTAASSPVLSDLSPLRKH